MGVRRLSIIDLAGGRQPLSSEDGNVWVAFNGELFEYSQLLDDLAARGHRLATRCDTEVWVHLYEEQGDQMLESAKGQFAVSLWDRERRTLLLARDRIGICPLYYVQRDGWLLWASEIKGLLASGLVTPRADPKAIDYLFCFSTAPSQRTFFKGIRAIPPGHYMKVHRGRVALYRYWDLDFPDRGDEHRPTRIKELSDQLEHHLRVAVRRRLRGDVPVVSYLSGGIDSTLVLGLASQENGHPIPSFTIGLDGSNRDERSKASMSARLFDSPLTTVSMTRHDIAEAFPEVIAAAEGPVVDTSCACMIRLATEVHTQGYKVALTGEGADEALAGYPWYYLQKLQAVLHSNLRLVGIVLGGRRLLLSRRNGSARRAPLRALAGVRTVQQDIIEVIARCRESLYCRRMWNDLEDYSPFDELNLTNDRIKRWHSVNQAIYVDYRTFLPGLLLTAKGDRCAMNSSVETRPSFLDEDVVAFCSQLHPSYKMRRLTEKWLLRQVGSRLLPPHIAWRRKHGFHTTFSDTFLGPGRPPWVDQLLSDESIRATGYFDAHAIRRQREIRTRPIMKSLPRISFDLGLTAVVATQLWHHLFCGGNLADLPTWSPPNF